MKETKPDKMNSTDLEMFLEEQIKSEGILKKRPIEILESYKTIRRPFRKITLHTTEISTDYQKKAYSFIDENLAILVQNQDQRMLLWRPNYARLESDTLNGMLIEDESQSAHEDIQRIIDDILELRWNIQLLDDEMKPKLKRIQADPLSAIAFILPRAPTSRKHEQKLLEKTRGSNAFILATSLVTNTSQKEIIISADVGKRVLVSTAIANYRGNDDSQRMLALEFPKPCTLYEAMKNGSALTRLCTINSDCRLEIEKA
ncbi:hypothetical protein EU527_08410 [Candidatus Thorarchaeota archaeon]|nr:MAG: hypothetical protein EU527_08410 [Candidatus Thorarchaeota archaeon]